MTVQLFKGSGIQPWFLRVVSSNGQVLAVSEGYFSRWNARRAARKNFPNLPIKEVSK